MDVSSLVPAGLQGGQTDACEVQAGYNKFSENLRRFTPQAIQCAIFCGGSRCKYENPKAWPAVHMAIQNIFSHWVTDDVLAMARPNTAMIIKKDIIAQFQGWSIKTIINLQTPGEHASCGVYYYNFALKDYGSATMGKLLDMVKVVAFAVQEGRVAIHCHAGLGRTGVLIACYLIYSLRVRANDAIRFVRMKRPSAIQTRGQIICIQEFEHVVLPQMIVFPLYSTTGDRKPYSLQSYLKKQYNMLHGYEQRTFKHIPKIVFIICERILQLCDCQEDNSPSEIAYTVSNVPFTQKFICHVLEKFRDSKGNMRHSYSWAESLTDSYEYSTFTKACSSSQGSSRGTCDDIGRLSDVFCMSPDTPSCDSTFPDWSISLTPRLYRRYLAKTVGIYLTRGSYSATGLDDTCVDDVLGDGIHDQDLLDNDCYKEIQSHMDLRHVSRNDYEKIDLNHRCTAWQRLELETDLELLSTLLFEWLENLKHPLLDVDSFSYIVAWSSKPQRCLGKLPVYARYLLEYLLRFVTRLRPVTAESQSLITKRLIAALTQQKIWIKNCFHPPSKHFQKLRRGTAGKLNEFFVRLMNLIEEVNTQGLDKPPWASKWELLSNHLRDIDNQKNNG
ncbi:Protein tyrosine phosphatase domain-containing protein 1 [Temnothorax longispinosus]|uniref:Protein tyrosine phosphatase domain-containing protein 1 n=1 Tax=Temnothorax longispinosus TaxID=300112 RepID=A0A4S2KZH6_9HYME|nr:Protein tyrosine phosphatase domain-containing protein 1 [Temnothorax longispinosus]